ncbi:hypothetical protein ADL21_22780 [Streptomyces albus subsp. albus]|nr:hypothetical protein ADL21_22780 [Streptomyces albus subsp. albus]
MVAAATRRLQQHTAGERVVTDALTEGAGKATPAPPVPISEPIAPNSPAGRRHAPGVVLLQQEPALLGAQRARDRPNPRGKLRTSK